MATNWITRINMALCEMILVHAAKHNKHIGNMNEQESSNNNMKSDIKFCVRKIKYWFFSYSPLVLVSFFFSACFVKEKKKSVTWKEIEMYDSYIEQVSLIQEKRRAESEVSTINSILTFFSLRKWEGLCLCAIHVRMYICTMYISSQSWNMKKSFFCSVVVRGLRRWFVGRRL